MQMLKIMFTISDYGINGISRVANDLINSFDKDRYDISLLAERVDQRYYPLDEDIKVINLNVTSVRGYFNKIRNIFRMLVNIRKNVFVEKPDVILGVGDTINCYTLLALLFQKRPKIIITVQSELFFNAGIKYSFSNIKDRIAFIMYKHLIFLLYRKSDRIIAPTRHLADLIGKQCFIDRARIKVVNNPIDTSKIIEMLNEKADDFQFEKDAHYVGVISRLSHHKKIGDLIKSIAILRDKLNVKLVVIGYGPDMDNLIRLAKELDLADRIYFLGYRQNPYKYLKNIDVFVLPTDFEGFGMVLVEAMACGVPVVASDIDVLKEVIESGVNGFLVDTTNSLALSECIYHLIMDKELKNRIVAKSYERVKSLDLENISRQYEDVIKELI